MLAPMTIGPWCVVIPPPSAVPLSSAAASGSVMTMWHGHARNPVIPRNQPLIVRRMVRYSSQLICLSLFALLAGAAAQLAHVFGEGEGHELERLGHCGVDVDQINEVVGGGPKAQRHCRLVDHLPRVDAQHRDAEHSAGPAP